MRMVTSRARMREWYQRIQTLGEVCLRTRVATTSGKRRGQPAKSSSQARTSSTGAATMVLPWCHSPRAPVTSSMWMGGGAGGASAAAASAYSEIPRSAVALIALED